MKISIITINYNNRIGLIETANSVLSQAYSNVEYIIIDGGSEDGSADFIEKISHKIFYSISESDTGIYNAMNKGIDKATGDYLLFLNSGDILVNDDVISKFIDLIPQKDILYGDRYWVNKGRKHFTNHPKHLTLRHLYLNNLSHQAMFFKRHLFKTYGMYNEAYKIVSDWEFYLKLYLQTNASFQKIDLLVAKFDNDGISRSDAGKKLTLFERKKVKDTIVPKRIQTIYEDYLNFKIDYPVINHSNLVWFVLSAIVRVGFLFKR